MGGKCVCAVLPGSPLLRAGEVEKRPNLGATHGTTTARLRACMASYPLDNLPSYADLATRLSILEARDRGPGLSGDIVKQTMTMLAALTVHMPKARGKQARRQ